MEHSLLAVFLTLHPRRRVLTVSLLLQGPPKKRRRRNSTTKNATTIIKNCVHSIVKRLEKSYDKEVRVQVKLLLRFMVQRVATTPEQLQAQQEEHLRELRARRMSQDFNMTMRAAKAAGVRGHLCHDTPVSSDLEHHRPGPRPGGDYDNLGPECLSELYAVNHKFRETFGTEIIIISIALNDRLRIF